MKQRPLHYLVEAKIQISKKPTLDPPLPVSDPVLSIGIDDAVGRRVFTVRTIYSDFRLPVLGQPTTVVCTVPDLCLAPGRYAAHIHLGTLYEPLIDLVYKLPPSTCTPRIISVRASYPLATWGICGPVLIKSQWHVDRFRG